MRVGNTVFVGGLIGALWAAIFALVIGILAMLISGETLVPDIGSAALSGAVGGSLFAAIPLHLRNWPATVLSAFLAALVLCLLTGFAPFGGESGMSFGSDSGAESSVDSVAGSALVSGAGPGTDSGAILTIITLLGTFALSALSWRWCLSGMSPESQARYGLEVMFIRVMKGLGFVFFTIIVSLPFYVMLMTSLKSQQRLLANPLDLSVDFAQGLQPLLRSYIELFTQYDFGNYLINSAIVSVATVIITLVFSVPGAYAVSRLKFPGQALLSRSILLIYMVPAIVLVIPLYAVFSSLGLRNTLFGLIVVYPATTIPVAVYMLQGYFRGLPYELEEAGLMDGLSRLGVILKITLPLSLPALASVSLYVFMIAWNEFLFAFMFLDDPGIFTLSRGVQALNSSEIPRQHLMAGAVVATVPVLVVFLWFERFLVAGLTAGSVKG